MSEVIHVITCCSKCSNKIYVNPFWPSPPVAFKFHIILKFPVTWSKQTVNYTFQWGSKWVVVVLQASVELSWCLKVKILPDSGSRSDEELFVWRFNRIHFNPNSKYTCEQLWSAARLWTPLCQTTVRCVYSNSFHQKWKPLFIPVEVCKYSVVMKPAWDVRHKSPMWIFSWIVFGHVESIKTCLLLWLCQLFI